MVVMLEYTVGSREQALVMVVLGVRVLPGPELAPNHGKHRVELVEYPVLSADSAPCLSQY